MALLTLKFVTDVRDAEYEVVEFHGELDQSNLANTEEQLNGFLKHFLRANLIFDFSNLHFINSEGVGFVVATHTKLTKKNQRLFLAGVKSHVAEVLHAMGMGKIIPVYANVTDTIAALKK